MSGSCRRVALLTLGDAAWWREARMEVQIGGDARTQSCSPIAEAPLGGANGCSSAFREGGQVFDFGLRKAKRPPQSVHGGKGLGPARMRAPVRWR